MSSEYSVPGAGSHITIYGGGKRDDGRDEHAALAVNRGVSIVRNSDGELMATNACFWLCMETAFRRFTGFNPELHTALVLKKNFTYHPFTHYAAKDAMVELEIVNVVATAMNIVITVHFCMEYQDNRVRVYNVQSFGDGTDIVYLVLYNRHYYLTDRLVPATTRSDVAAKNTRPNSPTSTPQNPKDVEPAKKGPSTRSQCPDIKDTDYLPEDVVNDLVRIYKCSVLDDDEHRANRVNTILNEKDPYRRRAASTIAIPVHGPNGITIRYEE